MNARDALTKALEQSMIALDDWLNTYADDHCDAKRVAEARARIAEYGTIGYIAHVQEINRRALRDSPAVQDDTQESYTGSCTRTQLWRRIKILEAMLTSVQSQPAQPPASEALLREAEDCSVAECEEQFEYIHSLVKRLAHALRDSLPQPPASAPAKQGPAVPRNMALVCAQCRFPVPESGERFCDSGAACPHRIAAAPVSWTVEDLSGPRQDFERSIYARTDAEDRAASSAPSPQPSSEKRFDYDSLSVVELPAQPSSDALSVRILDRLERELGSNHAEVLAFHQALRQPSSDARAVAHLVAVAEELCDAVNNAAEDIGGSRPINEILGELGPAVEAAKRVPAQTETRQALEQIAELDGDCEHQQFRLTRFQAAQIARRALAAILPQSEGKP